jgi:protein O-mannosyl-transferase
MAAVSCHNMTGAAANSPVRKWPGAALIVVATLLVYWPALHGGFIFDDNVFLTENPLIHAPDGLVRFWFSREAMDYWPVTSSTLWLEWRLWGTHAAGYHATNIALHIGEALLLWAVLARLRIPGAFFGALVFALHPLNAETVTWITQRKNLMATLFFLLSVFWFSGNKRHEYGLSLVACALAMLSKGSTVILPVVLLGIVVWERRPRVRDWARLAPFFGVAMGLAWVEAQFSTVTSVADARPAAGVSLLLRAAGVIWFYLGKVVWPADLCFDYGAWHVRADDWRWWIPLLLTVIVTGVLWRYRRRGMRSAWFAWIYFCLALAPVMGFAEVGFMRYSPVSDHYTHLALLGVAALVGAGCARLMTVGFAGQERGMGQTGWMAGVAATLLVCAALTWRQAAIYADAVTLYRDTVERNSASWIAQTNLGTLLSEAGQNDEAIAHLIAAVCLQPDLPQSRNDLGLALYRTGRLAAAREQYLVALQVQPDFPKAHNNLGAALAADGRLDEAIEQFQTALRIEPEFREAQRNLTRALRLQRERSLLR